MHPCIKLYNISQSSAIYGNEPGVCRITGEQSTGLNFNKWVRKTFNDYAYLKPGTIISNEALFCFDEASTLLQQKTGRDKLQRFRTYSHIIHNNSWHCLTKADKEKMFNLVIDGAELVSLNDTGQKHVFFKHKPGFWQLDELYITPNIDNLKCIHTIICDMLRLGFSQGEVITGDYKMNRINLAGLDKWQKLENRITLYRGSSLFQFASWMLFISEKDKQNIQIMYDKAKTEAKFKKQQTKFNKNNEVKGQITLW